MENTQKRVGVIGGVRIPFCRNNTAYADVGNFGMSVKVLGALVERFGLHGVELGEVAMGAVIKHSSDWNLAREALLSSGLAPTTPGITTARACGTSLDNAIIIANKIAAGQIEAGIAGGSDTTSDVPIVYGTRLRKRLLAMNRAKTPMEKFAGVRGFSLKELKPSFPGVAEPRTGKSMGDHCEQMAKEWHIGRARRRISSRWTAITSWPPRTTPASSTICWCRSADSSATVSCARIPRMEKLASLKPAFDKTSGQGTLTAAIPPACPMAPPRCCWPATSGPRQRGLNDPGLPARRRSGRGGFRAWRRPADGADRRRAAHAGAPWTHPAGFRLLRNPRGLRRAGAVHAARVGSRRCDYCKNRLGLDAPLGSIDPAKLNVHGSSLAAGHPFAATGARIVATLAKTAENRRVRVAA
jgi:acetyl-CoA C-acetyltransferase